MKRSCGSSYCPGPGAAATAVRDLPFAIAETPEPCVEGNYWTALAGPEHGIAYFNRGTMGSIREQDGGFSVPLAYSTYYVWGTRILSGKYSYEFSVYPFEGSWQKADLHRRALE
jgi:alpha-mannosidase